MDTLTVLKDVGARGNGDVYLGVVGPVRVGKSTFIRRFMEVVVMAHIANEDDKKRARDELPQCGVGKTITTTEPKFVPANGVAIQVEENLQVKVRLIDCVGYVIDNAQGYLEDGKMRMVKTPWFAETIPFDEAAKIGTQKVIKEHSTIGIVVLSDGSATEFKRADFVNAEQQIIEEMNSINRPFVIVLNSKMPQSMETKSIMEEMRNKYNVPVIPLDCENMTEEEGVQVLKESLLQFPLTNIDVALPKWVAVLDDMHYIKVSVKESISQAMDSAKIVRDVENVIGILKENEYVSNATIFDVDTSSGVVQVQVEIDEKLYDSVLKELVGCEITDKAELMNVLTQFAKAKRDYDLLGPALKMAQATGYGFSSANLENMVVDKPVSFKVGSRFGVKVKATAPTYHIIKVDLETSFEPILGSKIQSDFFLEYLIKAFEEDPKKVLECELFGQKFGDIIKAGVMGKLNTLPEPVKIKLQALIKTISNKGKTNLIAFVF